MLSWQNSATNATSVSIEQSTDGVNFSAVATASANSTSYALRNLQPATAYVFRIRAQNGGGFSSYSNTAAATTPTNVGSGGLDFSSGFAGAASQLTFNTASGLAIPVINGPRLRLTDGGSGESTSVFSSTQVNITKFTSQFNFQITSPNADGFTFTIQNSGPNALGAYGGGLGYGAGFAGGVGGIAKSVAIKFDLYSNQGFHRALCQWRGPDQRQFDRLEQQRH